ncbi:putative single-stranded DNA-binding protein [Bacillus phage PBC5]|nr:putative single-stranded DNA-binding protein [Bacillus phage PBC5]
MNKVILIGRLTKQPDLRYTPNGVAVATFTLAVTRDRKNKQTDEYETDFINCVVWQKQAETVANYVQKGHRLAVVGRWQTRNYEGNDGKRVYVNECLVESFDFIEQRNQQGGGNQSGYQGNQGNSGGGYGGSPYDHMPQNTRQNDDPFGNVPPIDINDDDLPF